MREIFAFLFLFFISLSTTAQTVVDTVRYRFSYAMKGTLTETSKRQYDDELSVDVGDRITYCYSRFDEDNTALYEKIKKSGGSAADYLAQQGPISMWGEYDIKNYPSKGKLSVITFLYKYFMYEEAIPTQNWTLEQGDTTIIGYSCKKARCDFRGRSWEVWYSLDIPISEGPWKLSGLPGMILYAKDGKNQFLFECIGLKAGMNVPMSLRHAKGSIKTSVDKVRSLVKLEFQNPEAYDKAVGVTNIVYGFKAKSRQACLIELCR